MCGRQRVFHHAFDSVDELNGTAFQLDTMLGERRTLFCRLHELVQTLHRLFERKHTSFERKTR